MFLIFTSPGLKLLSVFQTFGNIFLESFIPENTDGLLKSTFVPHVSLFEALPSFVLWAFQPVPICCINYLSSSHYLCMCYTIPPPPKALANVFRSCKFMCCPFQRTWRPCISGISMHCLWTPTMHRQWYLKSLLLTLPCYWSSRYKRTVNLSANFMAKWLLWPLSFIFFHEHMGGLGEMMPVSLNVCLSPCFPAVLPLCFSWLPSCLPSCCFEHDCW